jgi:hypothetical protein
MKRISSAQSIATDGTIFLIPINITRGMPLAVDRDSRPIQVQLGYYYTMLADFRLTPAFDCLLVGKKQGPMDLRQCIMADPPPYR